MLLFHHFAELPGGSALVRSLDFQYDAGWRWERDATVRVKIKGRPCCCKAAPDMVPRAFGAT